MTVKELSATTGYHADSIRRLARQGVLKPVDPNAYRLTFDWIEAKMQLNAHLRRIQVRKTLPRKRTKNKLTFADLT